MNAVADVRYLQPAQFEQIDPRFDSEFGVYWASMNAKPRPCFSPQLLLELRNFINTIVESDGSISHNGQQHPIRYAVLASKTPGIFNLGGDLALFRSAIVHRDRAQLERYAQLCVDDLFPWNQNFGLPVTTISLVQGTALGGGFEAALASSVLIAEESSRMGFPEVLFNLFPGMGAYSFLQRKVGRRVTEELITSGNTYTARQLYDMGVVDVITPDDTGEAAVYSYVRKHARGGNGRRAFESVRRELESVQREELERVAQMWVDEALKLEERDLKMMDRLVRAQQRNATDNIATFTLDRSMTPNARPLAAVGGND
ncbi:MAG: crotonase/enoyl-CoA hydratase family protein [Betaproteobacteria bacterium]|nr:crotonase/enoyl-CoA hydratase family protein [Betaproteobacteria bacterium]